MPDRPQVPRIAQLLGPAIDAWVRARPGVLPFLNLGAGRYADILAGWEAQCALINRQIADEVASARLALAKGDALTQLAASEFQTLRDSAATYSVGQAFLARTGALPGGVVPKGFRFSRPAATTYTPPFPAGAYVATRDVSVAQGISSFAVPITASLAGSAANAPYYEGDNTAAGAASLALGDTAFDANVTIAGYQASGGSDGEGDDDLRAQAKAYACGRFGPTLGAIVAGALSGIGVHRAVVFDVTQTQGLQDGRYQIDPAPLIVDPTTPFSPAAYTAVAIADQSWSSSNNLLGGIATIWEGLVGQVIADGFQGVGGQVIVTGVGNLRIRVDASILLRDGDDLKDTSDIDAAVLTAATSYFDDRPDWYTWTTRGLRAWLSRAHPKILSCPTVTVRRLFDNAPIAQPPAYPLASVRGIQATHWSLAQNGLTPTYSAAA